MIEVLVCTKEWLDVYSPHPVTLSVHIQVPHSNHWSTCMWALRVIEYGLYTINHSQRLHTSASLIWMMYLYVNMPHPTWPYKYIIQISEELVCHAVLTYPPVSISWHLSYDRWLKPLLTHYIKKVHHWSNWYFNLLLILQRLYMFSYLNRRWCHQYFIIRFLKCRKMRSHV